MDEDAYANADKVILKTTSVNGYQNVLGSFLQNAKDIRKSHLSYRVVAYRKGGFDEDKDMLLWRVVAMKNQAGLV